MADKMSQCYHDSKALFPLKAAVFCFYGAVFSIIPFLSSHMQALGLTFEEMLSVYAVVLLAAFFAPPIAGYVTDVFGHIRLTLVMLILLTGVFHTSLLSLHSKVVESRPVTANLLCTDSGGYLFVRACSHPQPHCPIGSEGNLTSMSVIKCRHQCQRLTKDPNVTEPPPPSPNICFPGRDGEECEPFSASALSPTNFSLWSIPSMYESKIDCVHRVQSVLWDTQERAYPRCPSSYGRCSLNCTLSFSVVNGSQLLCDQEPSTPAFPAYFIIRLFCTAALVAAVALFETCIVTAAAQHKAQYGKQKVWAYIAAAIFTPVAGTIVDQYEVHKNASSFYPLIIQFDVLLLVCMGVITFGGLSQKTTKKSTKVEPKSFVQVLENHEGILLLGAVFFLGAFWGVLNTFLPGFLEDLGNTKSMLGISKMVGSLISIPTIYFADSIMNKVGRVNILSGALLFYGLQLLCYSFVSHPWWSIAIEFFNFVTDCLKVAAMVTLAHKVAAVGREATTQGTIHCLHYSVGAGLGILVSGALEDKWHLRISFRSLAICSIIIGLVYAACYHCMKRKKTYQPTATNGKNGEVKDELPETGV